MPLTQLQVQYLRNLTHVDIEPHKSLNLIYGNNGSGKTSLLEAIYYLGRGKSFKTPLADKLIQTGETLFTLFCRLNSPQSVNTPIGAQRERGESRFRINGREITRAKSLTDLLAIQVIEPSLHSFFDLGPEIRRRFLEWGVFHVEPQYDHFVSLYRRGLAQRNSALKAGWKRADVMNWDKSLVEAAYQVDLLRKSYLEKINQFLASSCAAMPAYFEAISLEYYQGWSQELSFKDALDKSWEQDQRSGFTHAGPHRGDIRVKVGKQNAKDRLSRGEQKMFLCSLYIAQAQYLKGNGLKETILMIDDLAAELDAENRQILFDLLIQAGCQTFITATSDSITGHTEGQEGYHLFHVEHGEVRQVV